MDWLIESGSAYCQIDVEGNEYIIPLPPKIVVSALLARFIWSHVPPHNWFSGLNNYTTQMLSQYTQFLFDIDLEEAFQKMISQEEKRFPAKQIRDSMDKYYKQQRQLLTRLEEEFNKT